MVGIGSTRVRSVSLCGALCPRVSRFTPLFHTHQKALESLPFRLERVQNAYTRSWEAFLHYSNTHGNNGIMREVRIFFSSDAPKACKTAKSHDMP